MTQKSPAPSNWSNFLTRSLLKDRVKNRSGQVVIEYILLLVLVTGLGAVIIKGLVSRNADEPGILVAKWQRILETIAQDNPEE